jgi:hypothetical protein
MSILDGYEGIDKTEIKRLYKQVEHVNKAISDG